MDNPSESFWDVVPDNLLAAAKDFAPKKGRISRIYDVTVLDRDGNIVEEYSEISAQFAGRIRNANRKIGNHVKQIEISSLSGNVKGVEFTPPIQHHSQVLDKPMVTESKFDSRTAKANAKYQQNFFMKANAELKRHSDNPHILIYDKFTNKLAFSGTLEDAVNYLVRKMENGEWNMTSWVIYLPQKIYDKVADND